MSPSVIHLLPDAVVNQIKAGEVIQRPASVIKELMENSIDAGATNVSVLVQDAGRTQIMVVDDGCGMNETDARLAFEQHATSKITSASDLYALGTMGFRGEALASIAAIAHVELKTRREEDELGVRILISGSEVEVQEPCATPKGSSFSVRDIFYNTPARRRFLKSDSSELKHICAEFLRVALAHPGIGCSLSSNSSVLYRLPPASNVKQRVAGVAGLSLVKNLLPVESDTSLVKISGFIGTPQTGKKSNGDQYFFANDRYIRSPYLHKAVVDAYKGIIAPDHTPSYFIYLQVDKQSIEVNVHPQKTEVKFDDEQAIWRILNSTVVACLNDNNILPSIDFDSGERIEIPAFRNDAQSHEVEYDPYAVERRQASDYANRVEASDVSFVSSSIGGGSSSAGSRGGWSPASAGAHSSVAGWEKLYDDIRSSDSSVVASAINLSGHDFVPSSVGASQSALFDADEVNASAPAAERFFQYKCRYIVSQLRSGLIVVDQHRAHERVLYDMLVSQMSAGVVESQRLLMPEVVAMGADALCVLSELMQELKSVGLDAEVDLSAGELSIMSVPAQMSVPEARELVESLVADCRNGEVDLKGDVCAHVVRSVAQRSAVRSGQRLSPDEMASIFDRLMASQQKATSPSGKPIYRILSDDDLNAFF